ncbi:MAG TPA: NADH-ubiquinone oxidoreductase-F iron-sulfur binding region domain-containing protein [Ktedonobacterales bacterium]|nr:NADH-ubiquinone oxidoreductase-F iron-sulfur binding region domain-containing protein [Ktedonobacterales bacterium]
MPDSSTSLLVADGKAALTSYAAYTQQGGYQALRQALGQMSPADIIAEVQAAGLRGRGGSGVSAASKMSLVANAQAQEGQRYVVCNAYDADTRSLAAQALLERNPHAVLEGIALAAYAVGATEAFLYLRSTREPAAQTAQAALREAVEQGALGRNIFGSRFSLAITAVGVERGFMGGEETSMLEIIKGRPMKAQQRPPYPTEVGLYAQPTLVQNAETLANLPTIIARGAQAFKATGSQTTSGAKLLTVLAPGQTTGALVELPFGATLAQALRDARVEVSEATARAVVVGGMEGGALPLAQLDTPFDFESLQELGAIVGAGVIEALPANTCMAHWAMERATYLSKESCGKCVPCRVGVKRVAGLLEGIISGLGTQNDLTVLTEFSQYIPDGSLCGFGVNAVHPIVTAMQYFADDFTAHLEGRCPTGTCEPVRAHRYATKHVL